MTDEQDRDRRRRQYFEDYKDTVGRHREGSAYYESRAIDFATNAFRTVTYLNGGGLVAIPTIVALFQADPKQAKLQLLYAAIAFVIGLLSVSAAQSSAFFVMARRAEGEQRLQTEQAALLKATHYPESQEKINEALTLAQQQRAAYNLKLVRSDHWRRAAIVFWWLSLVCFVVGCFLGAKSVLG
jgi:hypothetical protein